MKKDIQMKYLKVCKYFIGIQMDAISSQVEFLLVDKFVSLCSPILKGFWPWFLIIILVIFFTDKKRDLFC